MTCYWCKGSDNSGCREQPTLQEVKGDVSNVYDLSTRAVNEKQYENGGYGEEGIHLMDGTEVQGMEYVSDDVPSEGTKQSVPLER